MITVSSNALSIAGCRRMPAALFHEQVVSPKDSWDRRYAYIWYRYALLRVSSRYQTVLTLAVNFVSITIRWWSGVLSMMSVFIAGRIALIPCEYSIIGHCNMWPDHTVHPFGTSSTV